jgi:branched-chain amino acid transport system permease protein
MRSRSLLPWVGHAAALVALGVAPLLSEGRYLPTVLISVLLFFVMGALFDFMLGFLDVANFGIAGFLCAGAYTAGLATHSLGISPWWGLPLGGLAGLALGLVTGALTLRLRGVYVGLTTLFVMEFLRFTISNGREITGGMTGLSVDTFPAFFGIVFQRGEPLPYYYLLLALAAGIYGLLKIVVVSPLGLVFRAIRDDDLGCTVLGFDIVRYKLLNFAIASGLMGVVGAFYAFYIGILVPTPNEYGIPRVVEILTVAYVGGRETLWGSLLGSLALVGVQEGFRDLQAWRLVIYGGFLVVVLLAFPRGLAGALQAFVRDIVRRVTRVRNAG